MIDHGDVPQTSLKELVSAFERRMIESALAATQGNQRRAAEALGLLPTTLNEKMKRLGLRPQRPTDTPVAQAS
jgi:DNA-binding NtrC family response regulator